MNRNVNKWLAALRSSEFKQARYRLRQSNSKSKTGYGYCCLGVACVIYQRETDDPVPELLEEQGLPDRVKDWYGLSTLDGRFTQKVGDGYVDLTGLNDNGEYSFRKIADVIESEPKGLFQEKKVRRRESKR